MLRYIIRALRSTHTIPVSTCIYLKILSSASWRRLTTTGKRFIIRFYSLCRRRNSTTYTEFSSKRKNFRRASFGLRHIARPTKIRAVLNTRTFILKFVKNIRVSVAHSLFVSPSRPGTRFRVTGIWTGLDKRIGKIPCASHWFFLRCSKIYKRTYYIRVWFDKSKYSDELSSITVFIRL